jgi:CheY-like chemotaxis protein
MVELLGHRPVPAENGALAIELASTQRLDAAVLEMHLSVLDGETVTRLIRNSGGGNAEIPIIGIAPPETRHQHERYLASGATWILETPIAAGMLAARLEAAPRAEEQAATPVLDLAYLEDMRQWIGTETVMSLLATAPSSFTLEATAIHAAWNAHDLTGVRENAHRLKGAACSVGCCRLSDFAQAMQKISAAELSHAERLSQLDDEIAEALAATAQWRPSKPLR